VLPASPSKVDIEAKALRERFELVVLGDDDVKIADAARAMHFFCSDHPEYRVLSLVPEYVAPAAEKPKRIASKYAGRCKGCGERYRQGAEVMWTPGEQGVLCLQCGGKP
jgi:hypothetical protein